MSSVAVDVNAPAEGQKRGVGSAVRGSLTLFSGQIGIKLVSFAFSIVVIRQLGTDEYGKYAICVAFGGLFTVFSDLGLGTLAVKRIARDHSSLPFLFTNILILRLLLATAVVVTTSAAAWILDYAPEIRLGILIASLGLVSYAFHGVIDAAAMGQERFRLSSVLTVSSQITTLALAAILVFSGVGFLGLLAATTLGVLLVSMFTLHRFSRSTSIRGTVVPRQWWGLIQAAFPFAAITLALAVSYRIDAIILSRFVSASDLGAYAIAYNLVFTFTTLSHSINLALYPAMTREHSLSPDRSGELFRQGFRYLLFVSLPIAAFVSLNASDIIRLLYGENLIKVAMPLSILIWALPLMYLSEFLGYVAIVIDREGLVARANWVSSITNVATNLALIPVFGLVAAATVTILTEVILVSQFLFALRETGVVSQPWNTIGRTMIVVALLSGITTLAHEISPSVVVTGMLSVAAFFVFAFVVGAIRRDEIRAAVGLVRGS